MFNSCLLYCLYVRKTACPIQHSFTSFEDLRVFSLLSILQTVLDGRVGLNARSPEYHRVFHAL